MAWACSRCTLENTADAMKCAVCEADRPSAPPAELPLQASAPPAELPSAPSAPSAPLPSVPQEEVYVAGARVRVEGMLQYAAYNGKTGVLQEFMPDKDRWRVLMEDGVMASMKAENMVLEASSGYAPAPVPAPVPVPSASAPAPVPAKALVFDAEELATCAWLVTEALSVEARGMELDRAGNVPEALLHYRRASTKFDEASASCPKQHPDEKLLREHSEDIQFRMVYLESLGGSPPALALEEHLNALQLSMDLSLAKAPGKDKRPSIDVASLVARSGVSGSAAPLDEGGYQLVAAMKSNEEMKIFIQRVLESEGRRVLPGMEPQLEALVAEFSGVTTIQTVAQLKSEILRAPYIELILDPKRDKLELAMALQQEGNLLEANQLLERAAQTYAKASTILGFVLQRDDRCKNEKVRSMVAGRLEELRGKAALMEELRAKAILST